MPIRRCLISFLLACGSLPAQSLEERWDHYVQRTYGWRRVSAVSAETVFNQTLQRNRCCFSNEIGRSLARRTARTTVEFGAGALLQEDIRRRPSGEARFHRRLFYALSHAPLAIGPNGEWRPAYSRYAGTFGGVVVSSAWRGRPLTASRLSGEFGWSAAWYFQDALWSEFEPDMKRLARRFGSRLRRLVPQR